MKLSIENLSFHTAPFRVPFRFGASAIDSLQVARVCLRLSHGGRSAPGLGAMPLGNTWSFPQASHELSLLAMQRLVERLGEKLDGLVAPSDDSTPFEASEAIRQIAFQEAEALSARMGLSCRIPQLCALVCSAAFDIALFDAWGRLHRASTYGLLRQMAEDGRLRALRLGGVSLEGKWLAQAISPAPSPELFVFHTVGGSDPLLPGEVRSVIGDGLPEHLQGWIEREALTCFKIKLLGEDPDWDYRRIVEVSRVCDQHAPGPCTYSLDFNEQCPSGEALAALLGRLRSEQPQLFSRVTFVEQPTPRTLCGRAQDRVGEAARLKPVVVDEGLTSLEALEHALELGYSGICLKACKGIGFSLSMAALARKRGLHLCVQDLTCSGAALLASVGLASWAGMQGIEANARQYCPRASVKEAALFPEVFSVRGGRLRTGELCGGGAGLGYGALVGSGSQI